MKKKDTIQLFVTGILVVVFVLLVGRQFQKRRPSQNADQPQGVPQAIKNDPSLQEGHYAQLQAEAQKLILKRDPFYKTPIAVSSQETRLSGIVWANVNPVAIINDTVVRVGDKVDGKTVVRILKDRVVLNDGTKDSEMLLSH
jgi:hypothetical protein